MKKKWQPNKENGIRKIRKIFNQNERYKNKKEED